MGRNRRRSRESAVSLFAFQDIIAGVTGVMVVFTLILVVQLMTRTRTKGKESVARMQTLTTQVMQEEKRVAELKNTIAENEMALNQIQNRGASMGGNLETRERRLEKLQEQNRRANRTRSERRAELERVKDELRLAATRERASAEQVSQAQQNAAEESRKARVRVRAGISTTKTPYVVECSRNEIIVGKILFSGDSANEVEEITRFAGGPDRASLAFGAWLAGRNPAVDRFSILILPDGVDSSDQVRTWISARGFDHGYEPALPQSRAFRTP